MEHYKTNWFSNRAISDLFFVRFKVIFLSRVLKFYWYLNERKSAVVCECVYSSTNTFLFQVEWGEIGRYKGSSVKNKRKENWSRKKIWNCFVPFWNFGHVLPSIKSWCHILIVHPLSLLSKTQNKMSFSKNCNVHNIEFESY